MAGSIYPSWSQRSRHLAVGFIKHQATMTLELQSTSCRPAWPRLGQESQALCLGVALMQTLCSGSVVALRRFLNQQFCLSCSTTSALAMLVTIPAARPAQACLVSRIAQAIHARIHVMRSTHPAGCMHSHACP